MKNRIFIAILIISMAFIFAATEALAVGTDYIYDNANLLSSSNVNILKTRCRWLETSGLTLIIYTHGGNEDKGNILKAYENECAENGALIFCTNAATKEISLDTIGNAESFFTSEIISRIQSIASDKYLNIGFDEACQSIIENSECVYRGYTDIISEDGAYNNAVIDTVGYLDEDELSAINKRFSDIRSKYGIDVAVFIDSELWGDSAQEAADDLFDYYFYGLGEDDDGILLYISKEPRLYWFTTHAEGEKAFNERAIGYLKESVEPYLRNDDYSGALEKYADIADEILSLHSLGKTYKGKSAKNKKIGIAIVLVLPFIFAFIMLSRKLKMMNTANRELYAERYFTQDGMKVTNSRDVFLFSRIEKTRREEKSSGGSHTSSSGESHGGGGGSY